MLELCDIPLLESKIFEKEVELLPSVTEYFELELAYLEYNALDEKDYYNRLAYFRSIGSINTKHYEMYKNVESKINDDRSKVTKDYFKQGNFSTGYCTHGFFPYRGKFHPQLVKSLVNIIGVKEDEVVFDPMCGSGTTNIECALNGINSIALDTSPFCRFMTKVKYNSLKINPKLLKLLYNNTEKVFKFFQKQGSHIEEKLSEISDIEKKKVYELALLAFLDSMGYARRVKKSSHEQLFDKVLKRYILTTEDYLNNKAKYINKLGNIEIISGSALNRNLASNSVDAVITSPPYSFAIDYVENDRIQLEYLGYDTDDIRSEMIGLNGKTKKEKLEKYFTDMDKVCREISSVLKNGKYLTMIIGSNTNQTGGIRLEENIIKSCSNYGLELRKKILKPIKGMRNTMREEYILIFRKEN